jgi:hypothetical protein
MKTFLIILGIIVVVLILAIILIPLLFKPQIVAMVKEQANKNINATVEFADVGLNLIQHFPNATLTVDHLTIINKEPFAGDSLASIRQFQATMNLRKLIFGKQIEIVSLEMVEPRINIKVLKDGRANYDIMPSAAPATKPAGAPSSMNLAIKHYMIKDGFLTYSNLVSNMYIEADNLQHEGMGDFKKQQFTLSTKTNIPSLTLKMNNIPYIDKAKFEATIDLTMDMANKKFTFSKNEIKLNQLSLAFDGSVAMAGQETQIDLTFSSPKADFKNLLSMVPYIYHKDFDKLQAEGQLSLDGKIKGTYNKTQVPSFDIALEVVNGMFQYSQLPTPVKQVMMSLHIQNPGKTLDETTINLQKLHFEILNEPMDVQLLVKTPVSDPYFDGTFKGAMDLGQVSNAIPLGQGVTLKGKTNIDFAFRGNKSALQNPQAGQFTASGKVGFSNVEYSSPTLPAPLQVQSADLTFSPQQAALDNFSMLLGKSDMQAKGSIQNIFGYVLEKQTLSGSLTTHSNNFNLNPFIQQKGGPLKAVELPDRVEFVMTSTFGNVALLNMNLTNVQGKLLLKDKVLTLVDMNAGFLGGSMITSGTYKYIPPASPHIDLALNLSNLNIPDMFKTFNTVQTFAPMAGYMQGKLGGKLNLNSDLGDSLIPIISTVASQGSLDIQQATIENFQPLNKVADVLQLSAMHNPTLANFTPSFQISDGRFNLKPVTLKLGQYQVDASGSNGIDKSLDYVLKFQLPASALKSTVNSALSNLLGGKLNALTNETVEVNVGVKGTINNPTVQPSLGQIVKGPAQQIEQTAQDEAKKQVQQQVDKQKQALDSIQKAQEDLIKKKLKGLFK